MIAGTPEQINERFRDAFNGRDLDGLLELYESDAVLVPAPDAPQLSGRQGIQDALRSLIALGGTLSFERRHCVINGDWALLSMDWRLTGGRNEGRPVDLRAGSAEVVRRQPSGEWKYVIDHPFAVTDARTAAPAPATPRPQFIIRLFPHRGLDLLKSPTPDERDVMRAHRNYIDRLADRGQLVFTGLSEDTANLDGFVIVEADTEQEARNLMESDPFVTGGLVRAELRPFRTVRISK